MKKLTSNICDFEKARTNIPKNFVSVIPLNTEDPMLTRAS